MAPRVRVAENDASIWAIGVRGFNGRFSIEVLVMVDGRTVYDPSFGPNLKNSSRHLLIAKTVVGDGRTG